MSFDTYHYADDDDYYDYGEVHGYQPIQSMTDEQKVRPAKSGSGVSEFRHECWVNLLDLVDKLEQRITALENKQPAQFPPSYGPLGWCTTCKQPVSAGGIHYCPGPRISYTGE